MKAVTYDTYGSPDVLRVADVPVPTPAPGEVRVRVMASSVNDYDWHLLTGRPWLNRAPGFVKPRNRVLGSDVAGVVDAVGADVTRFRPGDEVFADVSPHGFGAFAEYVTAPQAAFAAKPAGLSFEQAAAVPQAGTLAVMGLTRRRPVRPGDAVLVNGAGGGTGTFAVQIAKAAGAQVTAVDAAHKLDGLRALGADHVLDYAVHDFTTSGETYDLILDVVAHHSLTAYRRCLKPSGICAITGGDLPRLFWIMGAGPMVSLVGSRRVSVPLWRPNDAGEVASLSRLLEQGAVVPVIDSVFDLDDLAGAFRRFGAQKHVGKIVVSVAPAP
jgi:NADPH:quinone reductase-like Zn-dependent oxidoreductase